MNTTLLEIVEDSQARVATLDSMKQTLVTRTFHFCSQSHWHFLQTLRRPQIGTPCTFHFTHTNTETQSGNVIIGKLHEIEGTTMWEG
jgi:hypothetical protein